VRIAVFVALLLLAVAGATAAAPAAPGFRLTLLEGQGAVDSRALIGKKILVIRFQASYCKPCVRESPVLARLAERYRERDVEVLAIHVQDTAAEVRRFIRANKVTYPVALDPKLVIGNQFGLKGTPYTVVIDRRGEMVHQLHGVSMLSRVPRLLDVLLAAEPRRS
jgi:peroxiredoxin